MLKKVFGLFVVCAISLLPSTSPAMDQRLKAVQGSNPRQEVSRLGATWRSAIVPGWGQWYRGDAWWGASYLGAFAVSEAGALYFGSAGDSDYGAYKKAGTAELATSTYNTAKNDDQMWATLSYTAIGIYGINVLDAFFRTKSSQKMAGLDAQRDLEFVAAPDQQGTMLFRMRMSL